MVRGINDDDEDDSGGGSNIDSSDCSALTDSSSAEGSDSEIINHSPVSSGSGVLGLKWCQLKKLQVFIKSFHNHFIYLAKESYQPRSDDVKSSIVSLGWTILLLL